MPDNDEQMKRSQKTFEYGITAVKRGVRDLKNFIVLCISYLEKPVVALAGIIDTIVHTIIRIFSNYDELENDCNLSKEILEEISNNKFNDQGILKRQIHSILSVPLTVIIMYNWLYLTCFKERIIINTTAEEWIKSLSNAMSAGAGVITGAMSTAASVASSAASSVKDKFGKKDEEGKEGEGKEGEGKEGEGKEGEAKEGEGKEGEGKEGEGKEGEGKEGEIITNEEGHPEEKKEEKTEDKPQIITDQDVKKGGDEAAPAAAPAAAPPAADAAAAPPADAAAAPAADAAAAPPAEGDAAAEPAAEGDADKKEEKPESRMDKLKKGYAAAMEGDPLSGWKVYAPILHMIAPVSIIDKWIFGFFYIINTYVISPNLHPLLYYMLFFKFFFDFVRKNQGTIGKTLNDAIEYVFADEGKHPSITIPGSISQWSALFVTWSFASSIPEGVANITKEFWIVSVVKAFLFIISYVVIMVYIDQVCIYVILYLIYYSFFGILAFSKVGVVRMMHGIDMYFYKRIVGLQSRGDRILNMTINGIFLFIFEIIVLLFLIQGITDYIANVNAIELKITMTLINVMMIYLLMKYCSYKFNTIWPSYKNDVKDENYNQIRNGYFNDVIPIESYADGANSYNFQDAANALNEYKYKTDWKDLSKVGSNTAKSAYNAVVSNTLTKSLLTAKNKIKEDIKIAKEDFNRKKDEFNEAITGKPAESNKTSETTTNQEIIKNEEGHPETENTANTAEADKNPGIITNQEEPAPAPASAPTTAPTTAPNPSETPATTTPTTTTPPAPPNP